MDERNLPVLETARLRLALPQVGDAGALVAHLDRNHERLRPWSPPEAPGARTLEGARRRIESMHAELRAQTGVRFWLRRKGDPRGDFVGAASLTNIVFGAFRACYLGYHLDGAAVGQGLMQEALEVVIDYGFEELRLHRIMANYLPTNERSGNLLRRLGFVVEGYARDYLFIGGAFRDHVLTALTNTKLESAEQLCTPRV